MKTQKFLFLIVAIATTMAVNAQIIALHSTNETQIFKGPTALNAAYTASQSGDTLYLSGGGFVPPTNFDKQLMIIGAGHYPDSTLATGKTFINGNIALNENADNFHLEGVELSGSVVFTNNHSINGVVIKYCKINGEVNVQGNLSTASENISIIGSVVMGAIKLPNALNVLISNNIINYVESSVGNVIQNNIYFGRYYYASYDHANITGSNNYVYNNIFLTSTNEVVKGIGGNDIYNNLFAYIPNYGTGNVQNNNYTGILQADIFENQSGTTFNYAHNYHLQDPITYIGTDGTEVGIYGGSFPYKEGAVPHNPHIQVKNIAPTTNTNGDLQIEIQVEAQEN